MNTTESHMKDNVNLTAPPATAHMGSLRTALRVDWKWVLAGALLCFMLASIQMSGWPGGLLPNLAYPYTYSGDGVSHSWMAQRAIEGWIFDNPRSGYPFGSNFRDYPGADSGNLLVLKLLGMLVGNYAGALNLYFLLGFAIIFAAAFGVLRAFGLARPWAFAAAMLYTFVPFHLQRLQHLFYTWYFVLPLFFYVAFKMYQGMSALAPMAQGRRLSIWYGLALLVLSSFGVYYAIFGLILFSVSAIAALLAGQRAVAVMRRSGAACALVAAGVLLNIAPNIAYQKVEGVNPEVAQRSMTEAEIYGLKFMQMLMPHPSHRIPLAREYAHLYITKFPLSNENHTATLGVVGALGFMAGLLVLGAAAVGRKVDRRVAWVALLTLVLFLFGTIGGFGSLFSQFVSSSIRGWNRISIMIAFGALFVFFALLQAGLRLRAPVQRLGVISVCTAFVIGCLGMLDQTAPVCADCNQKTRQAFELDRDFIGVIERSLPPGSAVYQLPYMSFPEVPPQYKLDTYGLAVGFLQSKSLRWSYGGMKGREGDLFYRALATEPMSRQLKAVQRLGFSGIYIDRRGFADEGRAIVAELTRLLGQPPAFERADGQVVYFALPPVSEATARAVREARSSTELMALAGYAANQLGMFAHGIDFTRPDLPPFVTASDGLSGPESWGRWSDAGIAPAVRFTFNRPLPARFVLSLTAQPYGPNTDKALLVRLGSRTVTIPLRSGVNEYRYEVDLGNEQVTQVELVPPAPISPQEFSGSGDPRKLGVGLIHLAFE